MPTSLPMPTKVVGDIFTTTLWNSNLRDNLNKLLSTGHRVLTVAQFGALGGLEGTKGAVAPDEVYLEVDSTNGIQWHLAYESGEPTYKWRFLGGPPMMSEVVAAETTASTTYVDLTTVGPSITVPRGGDYDPSFGANLGVVGQAGWVTPKYAAVATADADGEGALSSAASPGAVITRSPRKTAMAASDVIKIQYRMVAGTGTFSRRWLRVLPVRIV